MRFHFNTFRLAAALLGIASTAAAQAGSQAVRMNAQEFEDRAVRLANQGGDPAFCRGVIERLTADHVVTDRAVLTCVEAHVNAASHNAADASRYAPAEKMIDEVIPLLKGRESLVAALLARKGSLAVAVGAYTRASTAFEASLQALEPVRLDTDLRRLQTLVSLGQSLLSQKKKKEAETPFLLAMSYPWYSVMGNPQKMQQLREQYVQAGRGLIESRRGDRAALREISFVPAVEAELKPLLEKAIQEAPEKK